jgi:hypothetical protein
MNNLIEGRTSRGMFESFIVELSMRAVRLSLLLFIVAMSVAVYQLMREL